MKIIIKIKQNICKKTKKSYYLNNNNFNKDKYLLQIKNNKIFPFHQVPIIILIIKIKLQTPVAILLFKKLLIRNKIKIINKVNNFLAK